MTTIPLTSKFFGELDRLSDDLIRAFETKGGTAGKKIRNLLAEMDDVIIYITLKSYDANT